MKVDVSLIVPVYNVNKYITRFFDSIDEQTSYEKQINTEIILVDDGSADDSGYRCEDYKNNRGTIRIDSVFKHILVIHQDNNGPAAARNAGIKAASGKYNLIVKSPGVPMRLLPRDVEITSLTDIFLQVYSDRVVGVSGTKGKSTTADPL